MYMNKSKKEDNTPFHPEGFTTQATTTELLRQNHSKRLRHRFTGMGFPYERRNGFPDVFADHLVDFIPPQNCTYVNMIAASIMPS